MDRRIFWYEFLILWGIVMVGDAIQLLLVRVPPAFLATQLYFPLHPESSAAIWITYIVQVGIQFAIATAGGLASKAAGEAVAPGAAAPRNWDRTFAVCLLEFAGLFYIPPKSKATNGRGHSILRNGQGADAGRAIG